MSKPTRHRHQWADKSAQRTWCLACGCGRSVHDMHPDFAPEERTSFRYRVDLTRSGRDYATAGYGPQGRPRGKGWCDRAWPAGWIPENAPTGYVTPTGDIKDAA